MRSRVLPVLAAAALFILTLVWWQIWREPIWAVDDLYFGKRSLNEAGQFDWGTFLSQIPNDLLVRNGRTADIFGELIFVTGSGKSVALVAVLLASQVAFFCAADRLVANSTGRVPSVSVRIFLGVIAACYPFLLLWRQPDLAGSTLLFMSATVGYFGGVIFICAILALSASVTLREFSSLRSITIIMLVVLAGLHHEVIALTVAGWWIAILLVADFRRLARRNQIVVLTSIVLSFARLAMPGMWARSGKVNFGFAWPPAPGPFGDHAHELFRHVAYASHLAIHMLAVYWPFMLAFFVASAFVVRNALRDGEKIGWRRMLPTVIVVSACAAILLAKRLDHRMPANAGDATGFYDLFTSKSFAAFVVTVTVIVLSFAACWVLRRQLAAVYALLAVTAGASAIPAALDSVWARPTFFIAVMTLLAPTVLVAVLLEQSHGLLSAPLRLGVVVAVTMLALIVSVRADREVVRYHLENVAVWRNIEAQILQVQAGERTNFEMPVHLPHPRYLPDFAGKAKNGVFYTIDYYHLPKTTVVHRPQVAETTAAK